MLNTEAKIESVLLFRNEPVSVQELGRWLGESLEKVKEAIETLRKVYKDRGMVIVTDGEYVSLGTHPEASGLIESITKEELTRDIGRAGLETLAIVLYKGPIARREIDYIRGVNSGFILRTLLIRGLIERAESAAGERSYSYKPTLKLLQHLGVTSQDDLPEYKTAFEKLEKFAETAVTETDE
jgi:segregation and condensation protein B